MDAKRKVNDHIRPCNGKRRKSIVINIPDDIIFHILVWLPADVLYNTMRYVCKLWYDIIKDPHFAREQLLVRSITGVCFYRFVPHDTIYFAQFGKRKGTLSQLVTLPFRSYLYYTCNGLILYCNGNYGMLGPVQLANPLTKQLLTLPPLDSESNRNVLNPCRMLVLSSPVYSIGFVRSHFQFKVVFTCYCKYRFVRYGVLTLGIDDKWRITDSDSLRKSDKQRLLVRPPLSAGKFIHWVRADADYILTMDVESEFFYFSAAPKSENGDGSCTVHYVVRGDSLTCMVGSNNTISWEVFVCLDIIGCKWESFAIIDLSPQKRRLRRMVKNLFMSRFSVMLAPVAWIENGEVVIFKPSCPLWSDPLSRQSLIAYNINTGYAFHLHVHDVNDLLCRLNSYAPSLLSLN